MTDTSEGSISYDVANLENLTVNDKVYTKVSDTWYWSTSEDQITEIVEEDGVLYRQSVDKVLDYRQKRIKEYPHWRTQLDMLYKDQVNGTTTWEDKITEIKDKYPKE